MTSTTSVEASERTQLLVNEDRAPSTPEAAATTQSWEAEDGHRLKTQLAVLLFVCALYFNTYACFAPETSLREAIICKTYYDRIDHDASKMRSAERDCTVDDVQRELTLVSQVYMTIAQLPGFFLALPCGILADRIGRKKVLLVSVIGMVLCDAFKLLVMWRSDCFPLRAIWLAPLFRLLGGADAVAATVVLAALADVYTGQSRTTVYARVASVATACELLAPLISSALMLKDPWIPVLLGFAVFLMGALTTLVILPETLLRHPTPEDVPDAHSEPEIRPLKFSVLTGRLWALVAEFRQSIYSILAINGIGFLLFGFFTITIGSIAGAFELQYTHKRFGWSYSFAGSILAIRPTIMLFILLVIIPIVGRILVDNFGYSSGRKDLLLARVSAALLSLGTLLLSVSETSSLAILSFVIFALGSAYTTVSRSLLTTIGPQDMAGTLLSAMNVSSSLGAVIAGPIIAVAFDWGLKRGGIWVGAPLFVVALLYVLTMGSMCILSIPGKDEHDDAEPQ